jgi:putative ABC transport system substrate-binding protein
MRRRELILALGGAAAWPLAARAALASEASGRRGDSNVRAPQPATPVVGFLSSISEEKYILAAFRRGLFQEGYVEGRNVRIEYRYADGQYDRLPALARELASLPVNVIAAVGSSPAALAAKAATPKIPIAFFLGADAVGLGLVASYNSPGGNITGVSIIPTSLTPKRLELLDGLLPDSAPVALLVNPTNRLLSEELKLAQQAARSLGRELVVLEAGSEGEIDAAFETLARRGARGLVIWQEAYLNSRRHQIVALAARRAIPTVYPWRIAVEAGGLMSYGADLSDAYRQVGIYTGRILKGAKPTDLPVLQPTKFELVINLKTAKALGLTTPPKLLALADEVIE